MVSKCHYALSKIKVEEVEVNLSHYATDQQARLLSMIGREGEC